MIRNYLVTTFRNWRAQKLFNFLNLGGLTLGIVAFLLISLYVQKELSYDQFFAKKEKIFRLNLKETGDIERTVGLTVVETGDKLSEALPEIEKILRMRPFYMPLMVGNEDKMLDCEDIIFTESPFFEFFDFPLLKGNPKEVLKEPNSVVLSASYAKQLFGDKDPLGELLEIKGMVQMPLKVTGVVADEDNSHIKYNALVNWESKMENGREIKEYFAYSIYTYFELAPAKALLLQEKINKIMAEVLQEDAAQITYLLQPLTEIYLHSSDIQFIESFKAGSAQNVQLLSVIALIILVVSVVNYINITTAKNSNRVLEVGVRKFLGASKWQLVFQFVGETFVSVFFSTLVAIICIYLLLPYFSNFVETQLQLEALMTFPVLASILIGIIAITFISGLYPALATTGFATSGILKNTHVSRTRGLLLRRILTTVHFVVSIMLVIGSLVVAMQNKFMQNRPLGFNQEQVIVLDIEKSSEIAKRHEGFKTAIDQLPGVIASSVGTDDLGSGFTNNSGVMHAENGPEDGVLSTIFMADYDFLKTYEIELVAGRAFNPELETDSKKLIVNEAFVKAAGWEKTLDNQVAFRKGMQGMEVIGVAKDFHFKSLHHEITPVVIAVSNRNFWKHAIRIESGAMESTLAAIESTWKDFEPLVQPSYSYVDDKFAQFYKSEKIVGKLVLLFTLLSIFIALLGLFGLSSHQATQRYKEIGIRKTLGASKVKVLSLFMGDIAKLLIIATLISVPLANFAVGEWLNSFPYHLSLTFWHFVVPILLVSAISLLTVLVHSLKAANVKIVETLRD